MCGAERINVSEFKSLKFGFCNVNCLSNKLGYVSSVIRSLDITVFGIVETWLTSSIPDSFVFVAGYQIVRKDTVGVVPKHGICLYVENSFSFKIVECDCHNVVVIHLIKYSVFLVLVYRPPSASLQDNDKLATFLTEFCGDKEVVIMGDFNLPEVNWSIPDSISFQYSPLPRMFMDVFITLGLTQWVKLPTFYPSGNILDLVLTSEEDRIGDLELLPPFPNCGHCAVIFYYNFQFTSENSRERKKVLVQG